MKAIKKTLAALLAILIAVSGLIVGFAETDQIEVTEEKSSAEIRMCIYYNTVRLIVFSDVCISDYETVNISQRDENNEKTLLASVTVYEHCYTYMNEPETTFTIHSLDPDIFSARGSYTLDLIAKEITPEIRKKDVSIDFEYEDILNPEIEHQTYDYQMSVGETKDFSEIITLPDGYMSVYYLSQYYDSGTELTAPVEINDSNISAVSRGNTVIYVKDNLTDEEIAEINIKVAPETPDNFLELLGSTLGIFGEDALKSLISLGTLGGLGLSGLGFTVLFPFVALFSFIGAIFGL